MVASDGGRAPGVLHGPRASALQRSIDRGAPGRSDRRRAKRLEAAILLGTPMKECRR